MTTRIPSIDNLDSEVRVFSQDDDDIFGMSSYGCKYIQVLLPFIIQINNEILVDDDAL